jgi:ATP-dependent protease HslVU (ClpYQ) ATPase subunit
MNKNIDINIVGVAGTEKTTISRKIANILKAEGFEVELNDVDNVNFTAADIERNLKTLKENHILKINVIQKRWDF